MIELGLANYYGEVVAVEKEDKYFLQLDNYDGTGEVEISQRLYEMIKSEFS